MCAFYIWTQSIKTCMHVFFRILQIPIMYTNIQYEQSCGSVKVCDLSRKFKIFKLISFSLLVGIISEFQKGIQDPKCLYMPHFINIWEIKLLFSKILLYLSEVAHYIPHQWRKLALNKKSENYQRFLNLINLYWTWKRVAS